MKLRVFLSILLLAMLGTRAYSEDKFGMEVYSGASEDTALTQLSKESADKMQEGLPPANRIQFEQSVYTTSESFDAVLAFYEGKFGLKATPFNPEQPAPLDPNGFSILQEIEMKDAATSAKFFNPNIDPAKYEGKVKLALFNKPNLPMVSVMTRGLNWKDGSVIEKTIISITKQPELPKVQAPAEQPAETAAPAPVK